MHVFQRHANSPLDKLRSRQLLTLAHWLCVRVRVRVIRYELDTELLCIRFLKVKRFLSGCRVFLFTMVHFQCIRVSHCDGVCTIQQTEQVSKLHLNPDMGGMAVPLFGF